MHNANRVLTIHIRFGWKNRAYWHRVTWIRLYNVLLRFHEARILGAALRVTTVVPASARKWIVAALKFARDLFVCGAAP